MLTLYSQNDRQLHISTGEALFADDGVSGIAAMQLARFYEAGCTLHMDLRLSLTGTAETDTFSWLKARRDRLMAQGVPAAAPTLADVLTGCAHPALQAALLRMAGLPAADVAADASLQRLAAAVEDFTLNVTGVRDFDQAQVTAGGLDTAQFDPTTMESKLVPGLYAAGEMLDVDGDCGGYNLMFAFAGGLLAGRAASSR